MTLKEYIKGNIKLYEKIETTVNNPLKRIMEDDLPYDAILFVDGMLQKVVYITEDEFITLSELLSYYPEEVAKMEDGDFKATYNAYMYNVDVEDENLSSIMSALKEYKENLERKENLLSKCM